MTAVAIRMEPKALATAVARCALKGVQLHVIDDDRGEPCYIVSKWALTRSLHSVEELLDFMHRVGA